MDEAAARTLLSRLADTEPPPARIDLGAAMAAGRRGRRWRWLRAGGTVLLAAGAAVALVVALLTGPAPRPDHQPAASIDVSGRFSLLMPYASFGWLPPGFREGAAGGTTPRTTSEQLLLVAVSHGALIEAQVYPAGICHLTRRVLACSAFNSAQPVRSRAPDVRGRQAYWLAGATLAWEYGPGAWSVLSWTDVPWPPAGAERTAVLRTAAGIRYGLGVPLRFPFWISGLPAAWHISEVDYGLPAGRPVPQTLHLGDRPGIDVGRTGVDDLQVYATAVTDRSWSCGLSTGQHVTVDGVAAILDYSPKASQFQTVCVPDWHGLRVQVVLTIRRDAPPPAPTGPHGVLAYARLLHPLGPSPASWTTSPVR